jgi:hypothetical protein
MVRFNIKEYQHSSNHSWSMCCRVYKAIGRSCIWPCEILFCGVDCILYRLKFKIGIRTRKLLVID